MTKKQKIQSAKTQIPSTVQAALTSLKDKFSRLSEVRTQITKMKALYQEHDQLMEELMPLFVSVDQDQFTIQREISIGTHKYRFNPHFYDVKKGKILAKVWKSTAFESGSIE